MYSSEDLERFYFKYQTEALPHDQSLQSFCLSNKVPYNIFSKWYRDTHRKRPSKYPLKGDFPLQPSPFKGNKRRVSSPSLLKGIREGTILGLPPLSGI